MGRCGFGPRAALICALAAVGLAGCGNSRTPVPSLTQPAAPLGFHTLGFPHAGIAMIAPKNWNLIVQPKPVVTVVASGTAVVTLWRYARTGPPPTTPAELGQATRGLLRAARARDPSLVVIRAAPLTVDHRPAIELDAIEHINGRERRVRSTHIYAAGAEYVLDEYAPVDIFHSVDHAVFSPIKRSVRMLRRSLA